MSALLLKTENLVCRRGGEALFTPVSLALGSGALLILRGPNGSGKTSLLRAIAGLLPFEGTVEKRSACLIGHKGGVHDDLTVSEHLAFWKNLCLQGLGFSDEDILGALSLTSLATRRAGMLSQGQRQRLSLCRLLIDKAPLWLLDEPTTALDEAGVHLLAALLKAHGDGGGAAIIASHGGTFENAATFTLGAA
jgi:heme exporter protein A